MPNPLKQAQLVRGKGTGPVNLNQTAPIFNDRRTKRNRDRRTQKRISIERSRND